MNPRVLINRFTVWFDVRPPAEKYILTGVGLGVVLYFYAILLFQPAREQIDSIERQLATVEARIEQQLARAAELQQSGVEDPDSFIRERLSQLIEEQAQVQGGIQALAGNLVSANGMTQMLTSVLDSQEGLTLIRVENRTPEALTNQGGQQPAAGVSTDEVVVQGSRLSTGFQVFRHALVLEFQGDFFSTLRYLRFLETMGQSFFWDSIEYEQALWPEARVVLELHTLSSEEGFIGV